MSSGSATALTAHRRQLVHHTARHSNRQLLGLLAGSCQLHRAPAGPDGQGDGHLEGGARGEPGTDRHCRAHGADTTARRRHGGDHTGDVARPPRCVAGRVGEWFGQVDHGASASVEGGELQPTECRVALQHHVGPQVDRHGERQASGVVGVVADEVDPPGGVGPHLPTAPGWRHPGSFPRPAREAGRG